MEQSGPLLPPDSEEMWTMRCDECVRCFVIDNCNDCDFCRTDRVCAKRRCFRAKTLYEEKLILERRREEKRRKDAEMNSIIASVASMSGSDTSVPEKSKKGRKPGTTNDKEKTSAKKQQKEEKARKDDYFVFKTTRQTDTKKKHKYSSETFETYEPRQCLNPDCIKESRQESKYCSDECGKMLAKMRLTEVLPSRTKEYFSGARTHEAEMERKKLQCEQEMKELTEYEKKLVGCIEKLHAYIAKLANLTPEGSEPKGDETVFEACVVCGQNDVPLRKYAKHVETCWTRAEKAISFGGLEPNSYEVYCENYDQKNKIYCKRLKSLCPEHRKQGPEQVLKICGYPGKWEHASYTMSEIIEADDPFGDTGCKLKKETCSRHLKWVPTFRGSIELEQSILINKISELFYEAKKCSLYLDWSKNVVLALMHNPELSTSIPSSSTAET